MTGDDAAVRTYRYLRIGIVSLVLLLAVSVLLEIVRGVGLLGSISAYYYTPARSIFVGVLFATGLSLVAVKGRGIEDALLNGAGILAPVVAVVPTPVEQPGGGYALPAGATDSVSNNVPALAAVALVLLGVAAWTARTVDLPERRPAWGSLAAAAALVVALFGWWAVSPSTFADGAHFTAAIGLFGIFVVVAWRSAEAAEARQCSMPMLTAARRRRIYRLISLAMAAVSALALLFGLLEWTDHRPFDHWLLVVEALLLALFAAFWIVQTAERWDEAG